MRFPGPQLGSPRRDHYGYAARCGEKPLAAASDPWIRRTAIARNEPAYRLFLSADAETDDASMAWFGSLIFQVQAAV